MIDGGNTKYLAENKSSSHATFARDSREDELDHAEAGMEDATVCPKFDKANSFQDKIPLQNKAERQDTEDQVEDLGGLIRRATITVSHAGAENKFLPNDALEKIITRNRVRQELSHHKVVSPEELDIWTDKIWEITTPSALRSSSQRTTTRKIFTILGLLEKVPDIIYFVEEGLYDSDLPFESSGNSHPQLRGKGKDGNSNHITLFDKWKVHEVEYFRNNQWLLMAPYFHFATETNRIAPHYKLQNGIILHFVEDLGQESRAGDHTAGGYADVWRIKIHPAHHNRCEDMVSPKSA